MSEREKDIIKKISENIRGSPDEKKEYLLGVSDGMAIIEKKETDKPEREVV